MSNPLSYVVLLGTTRGGRQGIKVAEYAVKQLKSRGHQVELLDALDIDLPVLRAPYHHYGKFIPTEAPAKLTAAAKQLEAADGFLVVDCEYNHTPSPGMINLLDHFYHIQYKFKVHHHPLPPPTLPTITPLHRPPSPSHGSALAPPTPPTSPISSPVPCPHRAQAAGLVSYSMGPFGGARCAYVLRNTLGELGLITAPSIFNVASVHTAFTDDDAHQLKDEAANVRFTNFLNELDWFTAAVKVQREKGLPEVKEHKPPAATQPSATIK